MNLSDVVWSAITGAIAGSGFAAVTMNLLKDSWLEKLKARYATELETLKDGLLKEQKSIQARIDRSIFVSRSQFDTEFNAMKDIFRYLTDTRLAMGQIRPMFNVSPANQSIEDRSKALFEQIGVTMDAYNVFSSQMENLSPFYPQSLYSVLNECRNAASVEITQVRTSGDASFSIGWYTDGSANNTRFDAAYHRAATIIRERLDRLSVVTV